MNFDLLAFINFCVAWLGYVQFSKWYSNNSKHPTLTKSMYFYTLHWVSHMLERDNKIADIQLVNVYERNSIFLASSCLLILASIVAILWNYQHIQSLSNVISESLYLVKSTNMSIIFVKCISILGVLTYGFFAFTWAVRQFNMFGLMLMSLPDFVKNPELLRDSEQFITHCAGLLQRAMIVYNEGYRSLYFALALMPWLISPVLFIASTYVVIVILYRREFHSQALACLVGAHSSIYPVFDKKEHKSRP